MSVTAESQSPQPTPPRGFGRATLWLAGSALLGSLALVLWNRRALHSMREAAAKPEPPQRLRDEDGIY